AATQGFGNGDADCAEHVGAALLERTLEGAVDPARKILERSVPAHGKGAAARALFRGELKLGELFVQARAVAEERLAVPVELGPHCSPPLEGLTPKAGQNRNEFSTARKSRELGD